MVYMCVRARTRVCVCVTEEEKYRFITTDVVYMFIINVQSLLPAVY